MQIDVLYLLMRTRLYSLDQVVCNRRFFEVR